MITNVVIHIALFCEFLSIFCLVFNFFFSPFLIIFFLLICCLSFIFMLFLSFRDFTFIYRQIYLSFLYGILKHLFSKKDILF